MIARNLISVAIFAGALVLAIGSAPSESKKNLVKLNSIVRFVETSFIITNDDGFHWTDIEVGVNDFEYSTKIARIPAHSTYTLRAMELIDSHGKRFNPFLYKPLNLFIHAKEGSIGVGWK